MQSSSQAAAPVQDLDAQISQAFSGKVLPLREIKRICKLARELLLREPNVCRVHGPVTICGDIHGQFPDLLELFAVAGKPPDTNFLFLGDYVNRGRFSVEVITLLLLLKLRFPDRLTLLRGNHEARRISQV